MERSSQYSPLKDRKKQRRTLLRNTRSMKALFFTVALFGRQKKKSNEPIVIQDEKKKHATCAKRGKSSTNKSYLISLSLLIRWKCGVRFLSHSAHCVVVAKSNELFHKPIKCKTRPKELFHPFSSA